MPARFQEENSVRDSVENHLYEMPLPSFIPPPPPPVPSSAPTHLPFRSELKLLSEKSGNTFASFRKFNKAFVLGAASTLVFLLLFGFVVLVAFVVRCDESKLINHIDKINVSLRAPSSSETEKSEQWITKSLMTSENQFRSQAVNSIQWIPWKDFQNKCSFEALEPAGIERYENHQHLEYVARATYLNGTVIGKFLPAHSIFLFGFQGQELQGTEFEILAYPIGTLSWLPAHIGNVLPLEYLVFGGNAPISGERTYICRMQFDGHLIVGKFFNGSNSGCMSPLLNQEISKATFEILVVNEFGYLMEINS